MSSASVDEGNEQVHTNSYSAEIVIGLNHALPDSYSQAESVIARCGGKIINEVRMRDKVEAFTVGISQAQVPYLISELERKGISKYIEANEQFKIDYAPDDPYVTQQWGLAAIEAQYAWNTTFGSSSVLVAVIDSGIDWNHPDLAANYVPLGYDWVNNDSDPMDDNGHGTHCAGIIASVANNSRGIAGIAQVQIMAEKSFCQKGFGQEDDLANAIVHAVDQGARILSCSWGGPRFKSSQLLYEAIKYAYENGILIIVSAGNDASSLKTYPAAYDEVIAVTATDSSDEPYIKTNFGDWVELAAPGERIYSTIWDDSYAYISGTSMAAPHVVGLASLIWSRFPNMTRDQVRAQLRQSADDLGEPGFDVYYGYGRINARKAVEQVPADHDLLVLNCEAPSYAKPDDTTIINTTILDFGRMNEDDVAVQLLVNGSVVDSKVINFLASGASTSVSCLWNPSVEGTYNVTVAIVPVPGEESISNNAFFTLAVVRSPTVIRVPHDYEKIQWAVDNASAGDTIVVSSDTYYENILVDKDSLTLVGEDSRNTIIDGNGAGTVVHVAADYVNISGFTVQHSGTHIKNDTPDSGILFHYSDHSRVSDTKVLNSSVGIYIQGSNNATLRDNNITANAYSFGVDGDFLPDFIHDIDASNTVNGTPIYYYVNQNEIQIPSDAGYIAIVNSSNITVNNLCLTKNLQGLLLAYTSGSIVENVTFLKNYEGLVLIGSSGNSISNSVMSQNEYAIDLSGSENNILSDNSVTKGEGGIYLQFSDDNIIERNVVASNYRSLHEGYGIYLESSMNNFLCDNMVWNNTEGIYLSCSGYNTLRNNSMTDNSYNFGVFGSSLSDFIEDIDNSNMVNDKSIQYLISEKNLVINSSTFPNVGYLGLVNCSQITVKNLTFTKNIDGVLLAFVKDSLVDNVTVSNSIYGISVEGSIGNTIQNCVFTDNRDNGIYLYSSSRNTLSHNNVSRNTFGIYLLSCTDNMIENNTLVDNQANGLYLGNSSGNTLSGTKIDHSILGVYLEGSIGNFIVGNSVRKNQQWGVYLGGGSNDNVIYHNNFVDNKNQVSSENSTNVWHNDYEGNYWSDYTGSDLNQSTYSLGIGDTPYIINGYNSDGYPLMSQYLIGDVNHDGVVDIVDLTIIALTFSANQGDENWNPHADLDGNNEISIIDITIAAIQFGQEIGG
ncbi:MAG TPA: NosD domain-containing protein [Candidatus Bathyarchaeia archaeon]